MKGNIESRVFSLELAVNALRAAVSALQAAVAAVRQSLYQLGTGGVSSGGGGAVQFGTIGATDIAAGGSGNVTISGSSYTASNPYANAATAGKACAVWYDGASTRTLIDWDCS